MIVSTDCDNEDNFESKQFIGWIDSPLGLNCFTINIKKKSIFTKDNNNNYNNLIDLDSLKVDDELSKLLNDIKCKEWFINRLNKSESINDFAKDLENIVIELIDRNENQLNLSLRKDIIESELPQILMYQLDLLGWNSFVTANDDLSIITLMTNDSKGRIHEFEVTIPVGYPIDPPIVHAAIPGGIIEMQWNSKYTLNNILINVNKIIYKYEKLFDVLTDLDTNTWILEPSQPTYLITTRRIVLNTTCSVMLDIDANNPCEICEMKFLGPQDKVQQLRISLANNINKWDINNNIKTNIELVLGIILPSKNIKNTSNTEFFIECGICYTYSIAQTDINNSKISSSSSSSGNSSNSNQVCAQNHIPDQVCSNSKCNRMYHFSCLVNWLQSIPTSKTSFGTLFGQCPYCNEALSVQILR